MEQQDADRRAEIAQRAYENYLERGCEDGQDLDDWLRAERELEQDQEVLQPADREASAATSA